MAAVKFIGLKKSYGGTTALEDFSLEMGDGELVVVVGPSGCGKSTLLRLIAGLEKLDGGEILVGDRRVDSLAPQHRDVAMVFQSYALYPHMTVRRNVEFPLRMRGMKDPQRRTRVEEVAALLEIEPYLDRRPAALSGGQRQRVALARALVREPALFLLDEPLSNLDARLRTSVRRHIRALQRRLGVTTLYVTHDQTEALTMGDRIVLLDRGRVQMVAPASEAYARPANAFVAGFLGSPAMNLIPATLTGERVRVGAQEVDLTPAQKQALSGLQGPVTVGVRAEDFVVSAPGEEMGFVVRPDPATIESLGGEVLLRGELGGVEVSMRVSGVSPPAAVLRAPCGALHFFSVEDGRRLAL